MNRNARLMLVGVAIDALGVGLVLPFLVIYLREILDIPLPTVGVLVALPAVVGLLLVGPIGVLIDHVGPRRVQIAAAASSGLGALGLALAEGTATAGAAMMLIGLGHAAFWPANQSLVAAVLPPEKRTRYFGVSFTLLNAGIGVGGIISAFYVSADDPGTFHTIYLLDALSFLGPILILALPLRHIGGRVPRPEHAPEGGTYREVLADRVFRQMLVVVFFSAFVGYGQLEAGWTAFSRYVGEVSTQTIGIAFAVNTGVIVVFQLLVLRLIEGRRRTRMLVVLAAIWAVSWSVMGLAGLVPGTTAAAVLVIASTGIFALGETLLSPISPAITNDLAPDHLRGRYNALGSFSFQMAAIAAPVSAGFLIGHDLPATYVGTLLLGCAAFGVLALRMERVLPLPANGILPPLAPTGAGGRPAQADAADGAAATDDDRRASARAI